MLRNELHLQTPHKHEENTSNVINTSQDDRSDETHTDVYKYINLGVWTDTVVTRDVRLQNEPEVSKRRVNFNTSS